MTAGMASVLQRLRTDKHHELTILLDRLGFHPTLVTDLEPRLIARRRFGICHRGYDPWARLQKVEADDWQNHFKARKEGFHVRPIRFGQPTTLGVRLLSIV